MAQFQDLTRCLLAAGGATHPEGKGSYLLYTDRSSLTSKHWTGNSFGDQELIAANVRQNSQASYLLNPTTRLIVCITSSSTLLALRYDDDDEEWVEDSLIGHHDVHPNGKLAASFDADDSICVFFQDVSGRLIYLNDAWIPEVLPADPVEGSPLSIAIYEEKLHVFYISATDRCVHCMFQEKDGSWHGRAISGWKFESDVKRFMVALNEESGVLEAYVLTEGNELLQAIAEGNGETRQLGKVDKEGKFVPGTSAECCCFIWVPVVCFVQRCWCW